MADSPPAQPARLFAILARESPRAVILRRGPTLWVQMILWDTQTDTFTDGQWFKGRVYERRCDLSLDGRYFIYFASKFNRRPSGGHAATWTAISQPPYFTALALWPKGDCWAGGGHFLDANTVWLNHRLYQAVPHPDHLPQGLRVLPNPLATGEDNPIYRIQLGRDGWVLVQEGTYTDLRGSGYQTVVPQILEKPGPNGQFYLQMYLDAINFRKFGGPYHLRFTLRAASGGPDIPVGPASWADWDQQGRLVFARDGQLLAGHLVDGALQTQLLADFNDRRPVSLPPPPEAQQW